MLDNIFSITTLNNYIKNHLENDFNLMSFLVKGELTSFKGASTNGHYYFALKDERSLINCVLFKEDAKYLLKDSDILNGDEVLIAGRINVYVGRGSYQIIVKKIEKYGKGDKLLALEKLKQKLFHEGLFTQEHKLIIPAFPRLIAIISAKNSAADSDVRKNILKRYPLVELETSFALMQGEKAPQNVIEAIKKAKKEKPDLIIVARGGGNEEDLNAFNDEGLARYVYQLDIPLISAIGHEINTTILDLVADKRASTPTEAAIIATPDKEDIYALLYEYRKKINKAISHRCDNLLKRIKALKDSSFIKNPFYHYQEYKIIILKDRDILFKAMEKYLLNLKHRLNLNKEILSSLSPLKVLSRGYSLSYDVSGHLITSIKEIKENDTIKTHLKDGIIISNVKETRNLK